jgi:hypothetical protein
VPIEEEEEEEVYIFLHIADRQPPAAHILTNSDVLNIVIN